MRMERRDNRRRRLPQHEPRHERHQRLVHVQHVERMRPKQGGHAPPGSWVDGNRGQPPLHSGDRGRWILQIPHELLERLLVRVAFLPPAEVGDVVSLYLACRVFSDVRVKLFPCANGVEGYLRRSGTAPSCQSPPPSGGALAISVLTHRLAMLDADKINSRRSYTRPAMSTGVEPDDCVEVQIYKRPFRTEAPCSGWPCADRPCADRHCAVGAGQIGPA